MIVEKLFSLFPLINLVATKSTDVIIPPFNVNNLRPFQVAFMLFSRYCDVTVL